MIFLFKILRNVIFNFIFFISLLSAPAHADNIAVQQVALEAGNNNGWTLDANFNFILSAELHDALLKGVPLYFKTEFSLTMPRWYWFDNELIALSRIYRLSYQPLTQQYRISFGGLQAGFSSLNDALSIIRRVTGWPVIERKQIKSGETYIASVRMQLDTSKMPKPFQVNAVNNRSWNLTSDWLRFNFTPPVYAESS